MMLQMQNELEEYERRFKEKDEKTSCDIVLHLLNIVLEVVNDLFPLFLQEIIHNLTFTTSASSIVLHASGYKKMNVQPKEKNEQGTLKILRFRYQV